MRYILALLLFPLGLKAAELPHPNFVIPQGSSEWTIFITPTGGFSYHGAKNHFETQEYLNSRENPFVFLPREVYSQPLGDFINVAVIGTNNLHSARDAAELFIQTVPRQRKRNRH